MWDAIRIAARNVGCIFRKAGESHKKCPRCRGSGLLVSSRKFQQSLAPSNEPCWFCEGVGALPIVGLEGFVLARAMSRLQTCKQSLQLHTPLRLELHHGKYPETRCNFMTFKPREEAVNLVHDFSSTPSWLGKSSKGTAFKGEPNEFQDTHQEDRQSMKASVGSSKDSLSSQTLQSPSKFPRRFQLPNRRNIQVSPSTPIFSPNNFLQSVTMFSMTTTEQVSEKGDIISNGFRTGLFGSASHFEMPSQSLVNDAIGQTDILSQTPVSILQTEGLNASWSSFPLVSVLKSDSSLVVSPSHRRPRKKRNCIREKSQKEALERARKIVGTLKFQKDELSLAEGNVQSDVNPFIKQRLSEARSIFQESSTGEGRPLLFAATSMRNLASYGQSWVHLVISSGIQDLMGLLTTRRWPSKS